MSEEKSASASAGGGTSRSGREPQHPRLKSSSEYLAGQASLANAAARATLADLRGNLARLALPASWIREHPLIATASGAGAGLMVGLLVTPRRGQSFKDKYSPILEKVKGRNGREPLPAEEDERPAGVVQRLLFALYSGGVLKELLHMAAKAIARMVVASGKSGSGAEAGEGPARAEFE